MKSLLDSVSAGIPDRKTSPALKTLLNSILPTIAFLWIAACCIPLRAEANNTQKVLVLHSYHQGYLWTDMIQEGLSRSLSASSPKAELYVEYMNTKRQTAGTMFPQLQELYKRAYANVKFDVIVASDNNALDFLLLYRDRLFPGVPVVFCGINDIFKYRFDPTSGYTGVSEDLDIVSTIQIALKLHPGIKKFAVITDTTETGLINLGLLRKAADRFPAISFIELHRLTASQLNSRLKQLGDDTIVLNLSFFRDPEGRTFTPQKGMEFIVSASHRPVYTVWDFYMAPGAVGGKLLSGRLQGENAAALTGRILRGEKAGTIPIVVSPTAYMFDYAGLQTFGISESQLPADSLVTGKPDTFYTRYKYYLWIGAALFAVQVVIISLLSWNIARRRREETARQKAEEALHETNELFSLLMLNSPVYVYIKEVTPTGSRVLQASENFKEITGIPGSQMIGKPTTELFPAQFAAKIDADDRDVVLNGEVLKVDEDLNGRNFTTIKFPFVRGNTTLLAGYSIDISERKRAEEALRKSKQQYDTLVSKISAGIYILHSVPEGTFTLDYVSPRMAEILNISVADLLADDKILFQAIHPDDLDSFVTLNQEGIQQLQPFNWEGRFLVAGAVKWLHFKSSPEAMENGDVLWHGVVADITERKKYEHEQVKIEKLESLGILAGGIAHDFNNILTGIMGNISFAQIFLDATHKSFRPLLAAEKASVRASELAHQLLTFARGGEPVKKVVSLQHVVNESVSLVLHGSNIKGNIDIPDSIHAIEADEGQMSQLFHNIIINAMQAMTGGGTLTVTAHNATLYNGNSMNLPGGTYVRLSLIDQGCGISDDDLKRIFDPYFTTKTSGNGLGLASVHSIVSRHGGHIGVSSVVGTGTSFIIHLPSIGETYSKFQTNSALQATGNHTGGSILVMDDEEMIREMTTEMLEYLGYQVTTCENGAEALAQYKAAKTSGASFSAVIMDLTIPGGMGGKETAQQILAIDPQACLIVSSGYSNDPIMSDFSTYGFNGAMTKPYNITELGQQLSSLLSKRQTRAQPLNVTFS